jgi:hypothetical protein
VPLMKHVSGRYQVSQPTRKTKNQNQNTTNINIMTMVEMPTNKALKAYAAVYECLDIESQTRPSRSSLHEQWRVGQSTKEILKLLELNPELKQMVVRYLCTDLMLRFLATGSISTFMIFHLPTQIVMPTINCSYFINREHTKNLLELMESLRGHRVSKKAYRILKRNAFSFCITLLF